MVLPVARPSTEAPAPEDAPDGPARVRVLGGRPLRVLVVDDEPRVREVIARLLVEHHVDRASSGREALARIGAAPDLDLVVCDVMMPDLTGPEVYERVRASRPELARRFVFVTGGTFTEATQAFLDEVDLPVVSKPFRLSRLARVIEQHAARRREI